MLEKLLNSLRSMRKRGIFLTILGAVLAVVSYRSRGLEPVEFPMELFSLIGVTFFLYALVIAVHNTNSLGPMFFSFRYTKNLLFPRKDLDEEDETLPRGSKFHYERYSDYLADRRKWSGMSASFVLAAVYFLLSLVMLPLTL